MSREDGEAQVEQHKQLLLSIKVSQSAVSVSVKPDAWKRLVNVISKTLNAFAAMTHQNVSCGTRTDKISFVLYMLYE